MTQSKKPHEILGIRENATKDEIEKRYSALLKRYKSSGSDNSPIDIDEVTKAYNGLMGYEVESPQDNNEAKNNPVFSKLGLDEKKVGNFFYYHKYHLIIGIIVLALAAYFISGVVNRVNPDLNIALIGGFQYSSTEQLQQVIKDKIPGIKEVGVDAAIGSDQVEGQENYAVQMKATAILAAGGVDVYIMDRQSFNKYVKLGAFINLDELADRLDISDTGRLYYLTSGDETEEHVYGIDVSNSFVLNEAGIYTANGKVAAIGIRAEHPDKAPKLIELLIK